MNRFGDFQLLCSHVPSYPWCNLFYRQLLYNDPYVLTGVSENAASAPVGVNPVCGIPKVNTNGSLGNIANIIACSFSFFLVANLIYSTGKRKAALGCVELCTFLVLYLLTLPIQLLTTGSLLTQGSTALVVLTAIHAGLVATLFWTLLGNAIVASQIVEYGIALSSIVPFSIISAAFFAATTYISLDIGFTFTQVFGTSNPPQSLHSAPLFVLTSIWPGVATLIYSVIMAYTAIGTKHKVIAFLLPPSVILTYFIFYYLLSGPVICMATSMKVDGSFIATLIETTFVGSIYTQWKDITEEEWDSDLSYPS